MDPNRLVIGKIHSVECENFVSYRHLILYPGEYLNVVIGPNGSGKSSIVAAIILGLGGNTKILSRATAIEDYIKNGATHAWLEVKIYKNSRNDVTSFIRTIHINGKSTWKVDGIIATSKDYAAAVSQFNIQISNLCQFLPQDRVQEFAHMNAQEMWNSTINSIFPAKMLEDYQTLKKLRKKQIDSLQSEEENKLKLDTYKNINLQLKEQIGRMTNRTALLTDIHVCEIKQKWLKFLLEKTKKQLVKQDKTRAEALVSNSKKVCQKVQENFNKIMEQKFKFEKILETELAKRSNAKRKHDIAVDQYEELVESLMAIDAKIKNKKNQNNEKFIDVSNEKLILEGLLQDLRNARADLNSDNSEKDKLDHILVVLKDNLQSLAEEETLAKRELEDRVAPGLLVINRKILSLENLEERKLNILRDKFEHIFKGVQWLRENEHLFQGKIYKPLLLELSIKNKSYIKYIENIVSERDLVAFTCEKKLDMSAFVGHLCDKGLQINVIHSVASKELLYTTPKLTENYKKFGFFSYAINMIEGPAPLLNYLCKVYGLHKILIGTEEVQHHAINISDGIEIYFAGNYRYSIHKSNYSGDVSTMRNEIAAKNLLYVGVDVNEIHILKEKLEDNTKILCSLQNQITEIEAKKDGLELRRRNIINKKKQIEKKELTYQKRNEYVRLQNQKIDILNSQITDLRQMESNFNVVAQQIVKEIVTAQTKNILSLVNYQKSILNHEIANAKFRIYRDENTGVEEFCLNAIEAVRSTELLLSKIIQKHEISKIKLRQTLIEIKKLGYGFLPNELNFKFKEQFSMLPNDLEELAMLFSEMQSRANCMLNENQFVIEEYEQQCSEISRLTTVIKEAETNQQNAGNQISLIHNNWYRATKKIIDRINTNFHRFMTSMKYIGEVKLGFKEKNDYDSYGIEILVQYRSSAKLQVLDRFVQSGGERAVAIAVYTLSLQCVTTVPFRCVDEINQGMDPQNERKFYEMLITETAYSNQAQYFFITPKLLSNLPYNDNMNVHIVYNGNFVRNLFLPPKKYLL